MTECIMYYTYNFILLETLLTIFFQSILLAGRGFSKLYFILNQDPRTFTTCKKYFEIEWKWGREDAFSRDCNNIDNYWYWFLYSVASLIGGTFDDACHLPKSKSFLHILLGWMCSVLISISSCIHLISP